MTLNRIEKARIARSLAGALTCIPTEAQEQLTAEEVYSQLKIQPVSVIRDEHTGWSWLVAEGNEASLLKSRLKTTPLKGYITRKVENHGGERKRLEKKLEEDIESRRLPGTTSNLQAPERTPSPALGEPSGSSSLSTPPPSSGGGTTSTSNVQQPG
ncbi:hypothetical protein FRC01_007788, partial [Tulasnella sp. 417]